MTSSSGHLIGRDVTASSDSVKNLISLVIVKNGNEHIANVTEHTTATATGGIHDNMEVKGHISGSSGFLQITWEFPTDEEVAEFVCEGNAVTSLGNGVKVSESVEVKGKTPYIADLVKYIHSLQLANKADKMLNQLLQTEIKSQGLKLEQLEQTNLQQETEIKSMTNEIQAFNAAVSQARHVESGVISCGKETSWPGKMPALYNSVFGQDDFITKSHVFTSVYDKTPVVHLSVGYIWATTVGNTVYHSVELVNVDETKFTMRCRSGAAKVKALTVSWISVPQ